MLSWLLQFTFCLILQIPTSPNYNVFIIDWPLLQQSPHHLLTVFQCCILFRLPVKLWLISRSVADLQDFSWKKQPVYHHSVLAASLSSRSLRSNKKCLKHIFLTWFAPVDTNMPGGSLMLQNCKLYRFCCWTLILLVRHWTWVHRDIWLVDWLIKLVENIYKRLLIQ